MLLDLDPTIARGRLDADDKPFDRLEAEREDFHARVRDRFLAIAADEPGRFLVLDAARPADELAADIRARVAALLAPRATSGPAVRLGGMDVTAPVAALPWGDVWGQDEAVAALQAAASDPASLTHAWLITGPPGSGRSTLAYAFAAALIAQPGDEQVMRQVLAGTHPDLTSLRTEGVIISIKDARALVERSYFAPSLGRYRVIVMEDADRMAERTSNVLLKALEEPPERTVWVLCAPERRGSPADDPLPSAHAAAARPRSG